MSRFFLPHGYIRKFAFNSARSKKNVILRIPGGILTQCGAY